MLFEGPYVGLGNPNANYDVFADAQRFVMIQQPPASGQAATPPLTVILNWTEELKRLVPVD